MKNLKQLHLRRFWVLLAMCGFAFLLAPAPSVAQSSGPVINVCSSDSVSYAEETVCLYGNISSSVRATASAYLTECCYLSQIGVDLQLLDNGTLVADTGEPGSTYESTSPVPAHAGDTYVATGWIDGCYGDPGNCYWYYHMASVSAQGQITVAQGFVNPKYVVVGVTYAPPGSSSNVDYSQTTSVGNTTKLSNSFQSDVGFSVSLSGNVRIPAAFIVGGKVQLTFTESTNYTQGSNSSLETTIGKENTVSYLTGGTPTFSPVDHDSDFIWIWVNPELLVNYVPNGANPAQIQLTGYAFDPHDPASGMPPPSGPYVSGPHVVEVQVGCLNGDFSCPSALTWLNGVEGPGSYINSGPFARAWAASADGYPYDFPDGEMPNLTFSDICNILSFDPLATSPSQCPTQNNYSLLNSLPAGTTSDGRFTKAPYPPNVIQYPVGAGTEIYNVKQMDTQSVAQGTSTEIKQAFGASEEFGVDFLGLWKSTVNVKESETLTWDYSWLDTLTQSTTLTNALTITGPPDPPPTYYGPVQFIAYQDNMFGTYVFVPVY